MSYFFFFNYTATTEIYTLSLHDALPICVESPDRAHGEAFGGSQDSRSGCPPGVAHLLQRRPGHRADDRQSARRGAAHEARSLALGCARRQRAEARNRILRGTLSPSSSAVLRFTARSIFS